MAITRAKKEEILEGLKDKFGKAKTVVFARYKGLNVADFTDLRNKMLEADSEAWVAKNSLTKIALGKKSDVPDKVLQGQTALFFSYTDELSAPKIVYNFAKNKEEIKIKGGIFEDKFIELDEVEKLAQIPNREDLLAKVVGSINAPVSNFVGALRGNLLNLIYTLNEIQKSKS